MPRQLLHAGALGVGKARLLRRASARRLGGGPQHGSGHEGFCGLEFLAQPLHVGNVDCKGLEPRAATGATDDDAIELFLAGLAAGDD